MEEKNIIQSVHSNNKISKLFLMIGTITCISVILLCEIICPSSIADVFADTLFDSPILLIAFLGGCVCLIISLITYIIFAINKCCEITVTDRRVYGTIKFGKRVDLPLDSITAIGLSIFKSIAITTASGAIKFAFIENRDEIYNIISKLLRDRQNTTKEVSVATADELKKYKGLLDSGVITQEEFDAKKKQLLGL